MHTSTASQALVLAAALTALGFFAAAAVAESTNVPTNAYYDRALTDDEKQAIQEEEAVTPSDGKPSVPAPSVQDVIPDAALPAPAANSGAVPKPKNEAEAILQELQEIRAGDQAGLRQLHAGLEPTDADVEIRMGRELPHDTQLLPREGLSRLASKVAAPALELRRRT